MCHAPDLLIPGVQRDELIKLLSGLRKQLDQLCLLVGSRGVHWHGAAEEVFPCLRRIGHRKAQTFAPAWLRQIDLRYYDSTNRQSIFRYT